MQLTARHDPQPELFDHYEEAIAGLRGSAALERELRLFEKRLLEVLGYGLAELANESFDDPRSRAAGCDRCCARPWPVASMVAA